MLCLALCFTHSKYILHALAGNRTVEAQEEPRMDKLHTCSFTHNVIAREYSKLHLSTLHKDRMHAIDRVLVRNSRVSLQVSRATVLGHACKCQV